jgi:hypothetical protein
MMKIPSKTRRKRIGKGIYRDRYGVAAVQRDAIETATLL